MKKKPRAPIGRGGLPTAFLEEKGEKKKRVTGNKKQKGK